MPRSPKLWMRHKIQSTLSRLTAECRPLMR
uniref:Uncharacterized protein n=1 Tax=Podoviridae sp. ctKS020 TaxID=2826552 RepID=A0A8S5QUF9_9CAUD|nr:MAG TPA: hypothetical protein [Podoviridae sp. ctKS020]